VCVRARDRISVWWSELGHASAFVRYPGRAAPVGAGAGAGVLEEVCFDFGPEAR
jgi:hypothetical protein